MVRRTAVSRTAAATVTPRLARARVGRWTHLVIGDGAEPLAGCKEPLMFKDEPTITNGTFSQVKC